MLTLLSDSSRMDRADEASRRAVKVDFAKFLPIWSSERLNDCSDLLRQTNQEKCTIVTIERDHQKEHLINASRFIWHSPNKILTSKDECESMVTHIRKQNYLDDRKEMSCGGRESRLASENFDAFTAKCFTPCICLPSIANVQQIVSKKANEILQFTSSREVIVSLFWFSIMRNSSSCNCRDYNLESSLVIWFRWDVHLICENWKVSILTDPGFIGLLIPLITGCAIKKKEERNYLWRWHCIAINIQSLMIQVIIWVS